MMDNRKEILSTIDSDMSINDIRDYISDTLDYLEDMVNKSISLIEEISPDMTENALEKHVESITDLLGELSDRLY